jgi:hypothetical protein
MRNASIRTVQTLGMRKTDRNAELKVDSFVTDSSDSRALLAHLTPRAVDWFERRRSSGATQMLIHKCFWVSKVSAIHQYAMTAITVSTIARMDGHRARTLAGVE